MARSITFVLTHLAHGGAETQVVQLCRHLQQQGWAVSLVSLLPPSGLTDQLDGWGIPWRHAGGRRGALLPRMFTRLIEALREFRPDVVHSHTLPANLAARVVRPLVKVPVLISSAHSIREGGWLRMRLYRWTDRLADAMTNCSAPAVAHYRQLGAAPPERIRYVPNGIDVARFRPDPERRRAVRARLGVGDEFLWLAVGRMCEEKDYPNLLAAAARALGDQDRLYIVGDGELRDRVEAELAHRRLAPRVRLLGLRTDVPDLMQAADAYVMSSAVEGLPIVLLEAAASGLPTVATRVGGNDAIVRPGETGWLVPCRDADALADAMTTVRALPASARERYGRAARAHVTRAFAIDAVVAQWQSLYEELLAKAGTASAADEPHEQSHRREAAG